MLHREDTDVKINLYTVTNMEMANGQDRQAIFDLSQVKSPAFACRVGPDFFQAQIF